MAIPADHIVKIFPRVITASSPDLETNGLLLSKSSLISASTMVLSFPSAATVGNYFGIESDEYAAADIYFTSYNNKRAAPTQFYIGRRIDADAPAWLRSAGQTKTLPQFKAITDGGFVISVDNTAVTVSGLDFSAVTSFSEVAAAIQAKLTGTVVTYSSLGRVFTITSSTTGETSEVGYASAPATGTDVSAFIGLREQDGAVLSAGAASMTNAENFAAILLQTQNFVTFTTAWEPTPEEGIEYDALTAYGWVYIPWTLSTTATSQDSVADIASQIKESGGGRYVWPIYGGLNMAAFAMGIVAAIPWGERNGAITVAFKRQDGIAPSVTDEAAAAVLEAKGYTYMGNFATRNANFVFTYKGPLLNSDFNWVEDYVNSIWLNNRLQRNIMDGLTSGPKVPYNPRGYAMIAAWLMDPIIAALFNAVIEPDIVLSERQKSELFNEAGLDISQELMSQGYYRQVLDPGPEVRARGGSPIVNLWYTSGGAVKQINVGSIYVQ